MGDFFAELRRRHIYRIGAGYVVVAWGATQVVDVISQVFTPSPWIGQTALIVLATGFPITLIIAWIVEGKAQNDIAAVVRSKATTVDWVLAGAVAVVIGLIGYQQLTPGNVVVAAADEESELLPNSIAVLPFANLSPDPDNAYFAAGIHDTLLNELAKISDMNVIARTSVLRYADGQTPILQIAAELNVETVMEGSVQYAENQVRVTAQLIDPVSGAHIWSENYDRDFSGIFAIQSEIASNIAMALEVELLPEERESIEEQPTESPEAYAAFLKAITEYRDLDGAPNSTVQAYLDEALTLDPEFALAHAWKAWVYNVSRNNDPFTEEIRLDYWAEMDQLTEIHAYRALALDPSIGLAHAALAMVHIDNWRIELGLSELEQALRLSPSDQEVLSDNVMVELFIHGRPAEAIRYVRRMIELDPNNNVFRYYLAFALHASGRYAEAIEIWLECLELDPLQTACSLFLARSEFARGDHDAALDELGLTETLLLDSAPRPDREAALAHGFGLLGQTEDAQRAFMRFIELAADRYVSPLTQAEGYMGIGNYEEALALINAAAKNPTLGTPWSGGDIRLNLWSDPMLEQPEFVEARNNLGFQE